jgi:hypothetical protein
MQLKKEQRKIIFFAKQVEAFHPFCRYFGQTFEFFIQKTFDS